MKCFAFLKGVNVGGNTGVEMGALVSALNRTAGCTASSFLNSGNPIISADPDQPAVAESEERLGKGNGIPGQFLLERELFHFYYGNEAARSKMTVDQIERTIGAKATRKNLNTPEKITKK